MFKSFPFIHQPDQMDCGAACLNCLNQDFHKIFKMNKIIFSTAKYTKVFHKEHKIKSLNF